MAVNPLTTTTKISDVIVPEIFTPYVIEKTAEKSRILTSGIAMANPKLNELVTAGGLTMNMPYWKDLTGDDEVLSDSQALTPGKIDADKDIAALLMRGRAWGANELAGALAGDDPMAAIGDRVSDYWARQEQKTLVSVLQGVFASSSMADHVSDISNQASTAAVISAEAVLDAKQLLGDSADQLQAIMMHSAVYTKLQKDNVIKYVDGPIGPSGSPIQIPTYLGYNIVTDDGMPVSTTVSTAGVYTLTISTAATAGDKISINGTEYTFVANDSTATGNVIKVGADGTAAQQAANIAALTVTGFTLANTASQSTVTFTNSSSTVASTQPIIVVTKGGSGTLVASIATTTPEVKTNVYTTYLFARGSIGRGEGTPVSLTSTETDRDSLAGEDILVNRRAFVIHPMGIKWIGNPSGVTPSNAELATGTNWTRVYESKNIGLVALKHKIA